MVLICRNVVVEIGRVVEVARLHAHVTQRRRSDVGRSGVIASINHRVKAAVPEYTILAQVTAELAAGVLGRNSQGCLPFVEAHVVGLQTVPLKNTGSGEEVNATVVVLPPDLM